MSLYIVRVCVCGCVGVCVRGAKPAGAVHTFQHTDSSLYDHADVEDFAAVSGTLYDPPCRSHVPAAFCLKGTSQWGVV